MITKIIINTYKNEKAFTLIEILMASIVFFIIGTIIAGSFISGHHIKTSQEGIVEVQQNCRVVLTTITRELRMAGYEPTWNWANGGQGGSKNLTIFQIPPVNPRSGLIFDYGLDATLDMDNDGFFDNLVDIDADGLPDNGNNVRITYSITDVDLDGISELSRTAAVNNANPSTITLAQNINSLTFSYLNDDGAGNRTWGNAPAAGVVAVGITVVAHSSLPDPDTKKPMVVETFTDPYTGFQYVEPNDRLIRRMYSTVVNLRNF